MARPLRRRLCRQRASPVAPRIRKTGLVEPRYLRHRNRQGGGGRRGLGGPRRSSAARPSPSDALRGRASADVDPGAIAHAPNRRHVSSSAEGRGLRAGMGCAAQPMSRRRTVAHVS
ncbi:MAG: hypothetical protein AMJ62_12600 [Myxococcales bacterium SG8_38]|nr:MAG: hypothetical protein AMJ62_12600 [Myxococcales bacterium SG8_38]